MIMARPVCVATDFSDYFHYLARTGGVSQSRRQSRDSCVEGNFAIQVGPPIQIQHATKAVPAAGIETESRGIWLITGRIRSLKSREGHRSIREVAADQFASGVEQQGVPEVARNGFVTRAKFPGDRFVHCACQRVRGLVKENFKSVDRLVASVVARERDVSRPKRRIGPVRS